jgi:hypothetical protein
MHPQRGKGSSNGAILGLTGQYSSRQSPPSARCFVGRVATGLFSPSSHYSKNVSNGNDAVSLLSHGCLGRPGQYAIEPGW